MRIACFGAYIPALPKEPALPASLPAHPGLAALDIAEAPVGTHAQFAIGGGKWFFLHEGDYPTQKMISLTEHGAPTRNPQGLLNDIGRHRWPRIQVYGLDLSSIASMMWASGDMHMSVTGLIGRAYTSHGSDGSDNQSIADLTVRARLDASGLRLWIDGNVDGRPGTLDVLMTWELLILRFPYFTRLIARIDRPAS